MRRERIPQPRRTVEECWDIDDLVGKQGTQPLILYKEDGTVALGKVPRERGLSGRHLAAHEHQLHRGLHVAHVMYESRGRDTS